MSRHAIAHLGIASHMSDVRISNHELAQLTSTITDRSDKVLHLLVA